MRFNSDINVLGSISDLNLIVVLLREKTKLLNSNSQRSFTNIKTIKSYKRYEKAINNTLLKFNNQNIEFLVRKVIENEGISFDSLLLLFWNASVNNELFDYLNRKIYFPALYSGRVVIKKDEVLACLKELELEDESMPKQADSTVDTTASKYLTLLKKFNMMEGGVKKTILHNHISDKALILFIYWFLAVETKSNVLDSKWLQYCFLEKTIFIQRIMQRKFMKYYNLNYSGDNLKIETSLSYEVIYDELK